MYGDVQPAALCLRCERSGVIQSVLWWSLHTIPQPERGTHLSSIVDTGSVTKTDRFLQQISDNGAAFDWQINVATAGGIETFSFWGASLGDILVVIAAGSYTFDLQNELTRINNELSNLHRRVAHQNELLVEQRSRLESILGAIEVAVVDVDPTGLINFANSTLERMFGIPVEGLYGTPLTRVARLTEGEEDLLAALEMVDAVRSFDEALFTSLITDTTLPVSGTIAPVKEKTGGIVARVITLHDLTIWEQRKQMILSATQMQASRRIAAGMAHNINNLLTVVLGNAYRLEQPDRESLPPFARESIDRIRDATKRAAAITERLMYYTQDRILQAREQDLNAIVRRFIADWDAPGRITLESRIGDDPAPIRTEQAQIETLLYNLIQNAVEAMRSVGTIHIDTSVDLETAKFGSGGVWRLRILDKGEGMDEETRVQMFEPFFSTRFLGRGIGLAAVDGIVRAHNGKITVSTAPDRGTTMEVQLPLGPANTSHM